MSTWIFLRGLTRDKRHWGDFPSVFMNHVAEAKVVCIDLSGNGELHRMTSATRIEDMVDQCRQNLAAWGYAPPYYLLALSLGAMVAIAWADRHPEEIQGCVLINTSLRAYNPFYRRLRISAWPSLLQAMLACNDSRRQERIIFHLTSSHGYLQELYANQWATYRQQYPVSLSNALRQLLAAVRYHSPQSMPQVPVLLLAGAKDRLVNPDCSARLAAMWDAPLNVHSAAGHDLPLDDGLWIARKV
ncbi:MAG: alpha/beta fold hydrolase, partial [Burkholderiaceae bacterium]